MANGQVSKQQFGNKTGIEVSALGSGGALRGKRNNKVFTLGARERPGTPHARRIAEESANGHLELFQTTTKYDGKVGREQHEFPNIEELPA